MVTLSLALVAVIGFGLVAGGTALALAARRPRYVGRHRASF